ncbi:GntR family transcriptional regulator [Nonomuraea ferruginea]
MPKYVDRRPRHQQIAADLRDQIMRGELKPSEQLPSTQQLIEQYKTANATVQRALTILKHEGFVRGVPGKGVYVRDKQPFVVDVAAYFEPSPPGFDYKLIEVEQVRPPLEVVDALELGRDETAILRRRLTTHAERTSRTVMVVLPGAHCPGDSAGQETKDHRWSTAGPL